MNVKTFFENLKAYISTELNFGWSVVYDSTDLLSKAVVISFASEPEASTETKMHLIEVNFFLGSTSYTDLNGQTEKIRDKLHTARDFLNDFQSSYAFCGGIMSIVPNKSTDNKVRDGVVYAMFKATLYVEDN